jgi:hypothetical protein
LARWLPRGAVLPAIHCCTACGSRRRGTRVRTGCRRFSHPAARPAAWEGSLQLVLEWRGYIGAAAARRYTRRTKFPRNVVDGRAIRRLSTFPAQLVPDLFSTFPLGFPRFCSPLLSFCTALIHRICTHCPREIPGFSTALSTIMSGHSRSPVTSGPLSEATTQSSVPAGANLADPDKWPKRATRNGGSAQAELPIAESRNARKSAEFV